jgi:polysaccharide pyruvyl transferase WcaK-like protein
MTPPLFATAATVRALERAQAAVILVGSYDGSGNYGDIAQYEAAHQLVQRLGPGMTVLPVLERKFLPSHLQLVEDAGGVAPTALFLAGTEELADDLLPAAAPRELAFGACYLYGGGYLNSFWGARKLAMLDAAKALLAAGGVARPLQISSGLQVEPQWIEQHGCDLGSFELLGGRDLRSRAALSALNTESVADEVGDDAIGAMLRLPSPDRPGPGDGKLRLNVHFAEHGWMGQDPDRVLDFYLRLVAELGRLAGRPLAVQPLIAYCDGRIDERPASERLRSACAELGAAVAEPLVLRPARLADAARRLGQANITLSCSYHAALTSLMLEVPALLVGDNAYYEQKATGLIEDFGLPSAFAPASSADPAALAVEIAPLLLDQDRQRELRGELALNASRLRQQRVGIEAELLGRLGAAATAALGNRIDELEGRLRQRAAEPADLRVELAALQTELEQQQRLAEDSPLEAELRVQEAEARAVEAHALLATALNSRSWRLAAPLRRAGSLLRRR